MWHKWLLVMIIKAQDGTYVIENETAHFKPCSDMLSAIKKDVEEKGHQVLSARCYKNWE